MFDHLVLPVADLEQARRFYEQALAPLGIRVTRASARRKDPAGSGGLDLQVG